ncbi:MAG: hypothetical protein ACLFPR_05340 [Desulfococcaceae bacterium]
MFANPFGPEREALDLEIAGLESAPTHEDRIAPLIEAVADRIEAFEASGPADLRNFSGQDQTLVRNAPLFHFFHARIPEMDQFIRNQEAAGDRPLPVPFAKSAIRWLLARNFSEADAHRYFEPVYQIRRALFFIRHNLAGCSPAMGELRRKLWNNVFTRDMDLCNRHLWNRMEDFSTLLLGETGTGKGAAAGAIGRSGFIPFDARKGCFVESFARSFIAINLSQYPETRIESDHRAGPANGQKICGGMGGNRHIPESAATGQKGTTPKKHLQSSIKPHRVDIPCFSALAFLSTQINCRRPPKPNFRGTP